MAILTYLSGYQKATILHSKGGKKIVCETTEEFEEAVEKYFGLGE